MRNKALEAFESTLTGLLNTIDADLEARYGNTFPRHPARAAAGITANPQYDGLFALIPKFSAGIGSEFGPGYSLTLRISTLFPVPEAQHAAWENEAIEALRSKLPAAFPNRDLRISRDTCGWKLHGDLSLN